jgi:acyl carrier protein
MEMALERTMARFGALHGVFHLAGVPGSEIFSTIQETDRSRAERHFRPKVYGLHVLERVLQGRELDFCLLQSSLSAVLGGLGFATYASANIFMDAFAHRHNQIHPVPWISVNWDGWSFSGEMSKSGNAAGTSLAGLAMSPQEGIAVFQHILASAHNSQWVISTGDLAARMGQWIERRKHTGIESEEPDKALHARPTTLFTIYAPPENELERSIVSIWQGMLGIDQVGIHDSFFELGGDSLMATQLVSKLRVAFSVDVPLRSLFEGSTIAELARVVEAARSAEQKNREKATRIMQSVQQLSDDEVRALLQAKRNRK